MVRYKWAATVTLLALALTGNRASASTYDVHFVGSFFDVFVELQVDPLFNVTSISGTVSGPFVGAPATVTGLDQLNTQPSWTYDNQFSGTVPYVSNGGILFDAGGFAYNLYSVGAGPYAYYVSTFNPDTSYYNPGDLGTLSVTAVPEPSTWAMMILGLACVGFVGYRRSRTLATAAA
jgi:hypothetical protein